MRGQRLTQEEFQKVRELFFRGETKAAIQQLSGHNQATVKMITDAKDLADYQALRSAYSKKMYHPEKAKLAYQRHQAKRKAQMQQAIVAAQQPIVLPEQKKDFFIEALRSNISVEMKETLVKKYLLG